MLKFKTLFLFNLLIVFNPLQAAQETWYWGFFMGPSIGSFSKVNGASSHAKMGVSSGLSFYFPVSKDGNTLIGPVITGVNAAYDSPTGIQSNLAFSVFRSFGSEPGDNFFMRGDLGMGTLQYDYSATRAGFGFLLGAGYGFILSEQTRFLVEARGHVVITAYGNAQAFSIVFGPLF